MDEAQFNQAIQMVREGCTLSAALKHLEIPASSFYAFRAKVPLRMETLARARRDMTHALVDQALDIVDSEPDPQRARVRAETRLKVAGKINPKEFGERIDLTVTQAGNPAELHDEGMRRARLMRDSAIELLPQLVDGEQVYTTNATDGQSVPAASPSIWD